MDLFYKETRELTLFSFGGGQDSWAILLKLIFDKSFRQKYAPKNLLVKMSDTGWEHPITYLFTAKAAALCKKHGIEFVLIKPEMGFHGNSWQHLTDNWEKNNTVGSVAFPQTCTDNIKIKVVDRYSAHWIKANYDIKSTVNHLIFREFFLKYGKIHRLLGIAKGEEKRVGNQKHFSVWKKTCMKYIYPLLDIGADRKAAQEIIRSYGFEVPPPSNCTICFFMQGPELIWLYRNLPEHFWHWVKLERNKLNKSRADGIPENKNNGPFGRITIIQKLKLSIVKYGHWSNEQIEDYKMSHGHCNKSKF